MAKVYIDVGGDKTITVQILDSADAAEDLSVYEGYALRFFYKDSGVEIETFTKNAVSGWDSTNISTSDEANGNVTVYLQRSVTESGYPDHDVWVQPLIQETDSNYGSSQYRDLGTAKYAFTFRKDGFSTTSDIS